MSRSWVDSEYIDSEYIANRQYKDCKQIVNRAQIIDSKRIVNR